MQSFDIECQNDDCKVDFETQLESEDCGDGSGHTAKCPACGSKTYFEVSYTCVADTFSFELDEGL